MQKQRGRTDPSGLVTVPATGSADASDWIGSRLKSVYQATVEEPLPDDLCALLDQLDDKPRKDREQ